MNTSDPIAYYVEGEIADLFRKLRSKYSNFKVLAVMGDVELSLQLTPDDFNNTQKTLETVVLPELTKKNGDACEVKSVTHPGCPEKNCMRYDYSTSRLKEKMDLCNCGYFFYGRYPELD